MDYVERLKQQLEGFKKIKSPRIDESVSMLEDMISSRLTEIDADIQRLKRLEENKK